MTQDGQVRGSCGRRLLSRGLSLRVAALKTGMDEKTVRKYGSGWQDEGETPVEPKSGSPFRFAASHHPPREDRKEAGNLIVAKGGGIIVAEQSVYSDRLARPTSCASPTLMRPKCSGVSLVTRLKSQIETATTGSKSRTSVNFPCTGRRCSREPTASHSSETIGAFGLQIR